jgi:hypothetical protein
LSDKLVSAGWIVYPPILNEIATKSYCIYYLNEKLNLLSADDWLLFYYVGHADIYVSNDLSDENPVNLVTSLFKVSIDGSLPSPYFTDEDYYGIVQNFKAKAPQGHLITVLDCCYAFGIIRNYISESDFHTVFAASNADSKAAYTDNSFFFKSFKKAWDQDSFEQIKSSTESFMRNDFAGYSYVNFCDIQIANRFQDNNF